MPDVREAACQVHRSAFNDVLVIALAGVWLVAGLGKLFHAEDFSFILTQHNLLPNAMVRYSWLLGVCEILLAAALVSVPKHRTAYLLACGISAALLATFSLYLLLLPGDTLRQFGCGCQLLSHFSPSTAANNRWIMLGADGGLLIVSIVLTQNAMRSSPQTDRVN